MTRIGWLGGRRVLAVLIVVVAVGCAWAWMRSAPTRGQEPALTVLTVNTSQPGNPFAAGAVGLSTETSSLGSGYLSPSRSGLARLMRMLGPSVLRVGGNSVDLSWWTSNEEPHPSWATNIVTPADLEVLHELLSATGWKVILGVNLGHFEPTRVVNEVGYAQRSLGKALLGVEIGNEPDDFDRKTQLRPSTYSANEYLNEVSIYARALSATGVRLYGPALGRTEWLTQMGTAAQVFVELTLHYYPTSTCTGRGPATAELLLPEVRQQEDGTLEALVRAGSIARRSMRIGETNAAACVVSPSTHPIFATALWALDWALRAASDGTHGINFHGIFGACGAHSDSPICAPTEQAARAGDVTAQPEYYGLLAARQLEGGRFVPTHLITTDPLPNLTTWATLASDGTVKVAIDNLATEGLPQHVSIPASRYIATAETLSGPSTGANTDISFGGMPVTAAGRWHPSPLRLGGDRAIHVIVPAASAVIITLSRARSGHSNHAVRVSTMQQTDNVR